MTLTRRTAPLYALIPLVVATAADAQDGGIRSVFADGAGTRALGIGSAYTAVLDDPGAIFWNPGAPAFATRSSFDAAHSSLFGLGFGEQHALLALPSWRYGVATLTFRRFGVNDLDVRDDRNVLSDDGASDNQTEFGVGFARAVGDAWGVGGRIKFQRQSLYGLSDMGLGLDLGVAGRPLTAFAPNSPLAERVSFGIGLRNVVEPVLRLDQDDVSDPASFAWGLAYTHRFSTRGQALITIDGENARDGDYATRAGLELRLHDALAVRLGASHGYMHLGTGVSLGNLGVDYVFEANPLGDVHRVGIRTAFGSTTQERHEAFVARREKAIESRLADAFTAQNRSRADRLLGEARAAVQGRRYEDAVSRIGLLRVLAPEVGDLDGLEASALAGQALAYERSSDLPSAAILLAQAAALAPADRSIAISRARVDTELANRRARSDVLRSRFAEAIDAFSAGDLARAREGFAAVVTAAPEDGEARAMLRNTEDSIRLRLSSLVEQARTLADATRFDDALRVARRARELDPDALAPIALEAELARRRDARQAELAAAASSRSATPEDTAPSVPVVPALTGDERRELDEQYAKGLDAMNGGRTDDAVRYWEFVWSKEATFKDVANHLSREYLTRGMEHFADGHLSDAIATWEDALRVNPDDDRARAYLDRAYEQLARYEKIVSPRVAGAR